jgi:hypothetical protein
MTKPKENRLVPLTQDEPGLVTADRDYRNCRNRQLYSQVGLIPIGQGSPTTPTTIDTTASTAVDTTRAPWLSCLLSRHLKTFAGTPATVCLSSTLRRLLRPFKNTPLKRVYLLKGEDAHVFAIPTQPSCLTARVASCLRSLPSSPSEGVNI